MSTTNSTVRTHTDEEWRKVRDWPYEVSSLGRLRRLTRASGTYAGRILNPKPRPRYCIVTLRGPSGQKDAHVHRLVAEAFLGPCGSGLQVNHIDGDKTNNVVSNLEYITQDANMSHASRVGLIPRGEQCHQALLTREDVDEIRLAYAAGGVTYTDLAHQYRVSKSCIGHVIRRKNWK